MKKKLLLVCAFAVIGGLLFVSVQKQSGQVVGVIVPMEHEALTQIVNGLQEELDLSNNKQITLKVMNAQGDLNIQRAIIQQLLRDKCDLLVPIGTAASQMTLNLAKDRNVVCLAADLSLIASQNNLHATGLDDELSATDSLEFLHKAFPEIKKITLLYSASEKIAKEVPVVADAASARGMEVQNLMIQNMSELYTFSRAIASDSDAILILKDHLIVSGIQTIVMQAEKRGIPVMTSDEGSVTRGGAFAIGVKEASIGHQGALIVRDILNGRLPQHIAPQTMHGPYLLFVNRVSCIKQGIDLPRFIEGVEKMGFPIAYTDSKEEV